MDGSVCPVREDALGLLSLRHGPKLFSADVAQSSWIALMRPRYLHNYSAAQRPPHRRHGDRVVRVGNRRARIISDLGCRVELGGLGWRIGSGVRGLYLFPSSKPLVEICQRPSPRLRATTHSAVLLWLL
jgi:hypothetical protein